MNYLLPISALLAGSGFLMFAGGINGLILPLRGSIEGFSAFNLGLLGAAWAIGYVSGCLLTPRLVARVGHIRSFAVLASAAAISILVSLLVIHPAAWIVFRALAGFCFAGAAMIVESWLNEQTEATQRGRVFGFYTMINLAATTAGSLVISLGDARSGAFFILAAIFYCLALMPPALTSTHAPRPLVQVDLGLRGLWRNSPVAVVAALLIGVANGAFGTLGPVYAERIDLPIATIALFMSLSVLAGAAMQLPVGLLSDRMDRRIVVLLLALLAAATELYFLLGRPTGAMANLIAASILGGALYSLYPVLVAHAADRASVDSFLRVSGGLLLLFGMGAIVGPVFAGVAMALTGPHGLFAITLGAHLSIAAFALLRMRLRDQPEMQEKSGFVTSMPARLTTPETVALDPRAEPSATP